MNLTEACAYVKDRTHAIATSGFQLGETRPLIDRNTLIRINRTHGRDEVEASLYPLVFQFFREHVARWGWFYPSTDETLAEACKKLNSKAEALTEEIEGRSSVATGFLHANFPSFWEVRGGPVEAFRADARLRSVLLYRMGLNNSKAYVYDVDGEKVSTRETFDLSIRNIRRGFVVQRQSVSFFKPLVAASLYRTWVRNTDAPVVWDPSCGFGARLLGFASVFPKGTYLGNEPAIRTRQDLMRLSQRLIREGLIQDVRISGKGSEIEPIEPRSLDMVMTSPPYFDLEKYFDEPGQCWRDYPNLEKWELNYLVPTMERAYRGLKPGGRFLINVNRKHGELIKKCAAQTGFREVYEHTLMLGQDHFARKAEAGKRSEPVFVWEKP